MSVTKRRNRRKPYPTYPNGRTDRKPLDARGWSTSNINGMAAERNGALWNKAETSYLIRAFEWGASVSDIAVDHQRTEGGIDMQLQRLGVLVVEVGVGLRLASSHAA